jgi:hypothetical protein
MTSKTKSKPATNTTEVVATPEYLCLKLATAHKSGQRADGQMQYRILANSVLTELFIMIVGNDGSGYYSKEAVPFSKIEHCLSTVAGQKTFPSKVFLPAFVGRSANNPGFLAAILRAEGLLKPVPEKANLHQLASDWQVWKTGTLKLPNEPFTAPTTSNISNEILPVHTQPNASITTMTTNQDDAYSEDDANDPIARLTSRKLRKPPGDKYQHPSIEGTDDVDTP